MTHYSSKSDRKSLDIVLSVWEQYQAHFAFRGAIEKRNDRDKKTIVVKIGLKYYDRSCKPDPSSPFKPIVPLEGTALRDTIQSYLDVLARVDTRGIRNPLTSPIAHIRRQLTIEAIERIQGAQSEDTLGYWLGLLGCNFESSARLIDRRCQELRKKGEVSHRAFKIAMGRSASREDVINVRRNIARHSPGLISFLEPKLSRSKLPIIKGLTVTTIAVTECAEVLALYPIGQRKKMIARIAEGIRSGLRPTHSLTQVEADRARKTFQAIGLYHSNPAMFPRGKDLKWSFSRVYTAIIAIETC